jgi:hypothetical protein
MSIQPPTNPVTSIANRLGLNRLHSGGRLQPAMFGREILQGALGKVIAHRGMARPLPVQRSKLVQAMLRAGATVARDIRGVDVAQMSPARRREMAGQAVDEAMERVFGSEALTGEQKSEVRKLLTDALDVLAADGQKLLAQQQKIEKVAKDFEGIFVRQIMDVMRKTVDESGLGGDASSKQIRDMYWMFLGDQVAPTGSLGMWKQIAADIAESQQPLSGSTLETLE